jgi:hypothetical protein
MMCLIEKKYCKINLHNNVIRSFQTLMFLNYRLIVMERCKKSSGLHWDIVLLCLLNVPATFFGGPWMCVAQVRAMTHMAALTVMSTNHAPGESPKVVEVKGIV